MKRTCISIILWWLTSRNRNLVLTYPWILAWGTRNSNCRYLTMYILVLLTSFQVRDKQNSWGEIREKRSIDSYLHRRNEINRFIRRCWIGNLRHSRALEERVSARSLSFVVFRLFTKYWQPRSAMRLPISFRYVFIIYNATWDLYT